MKPEPSAMRWPRGSVGVRAAVAALLLVEEAAQEFVEGRLRQVGRRVAGTGPWAWSLSLSLS